MRPSEALGPIPPYLRKAALSLAAPQWHLRQPQGLCSSVGAESFDPKLRDCLRKGDTYTVTVTAPGNPPKPSLIVKALMNPTDIRWNPNILCESTIGATAMEGVLVYYIAAEYEAYPSHQAKWWRPLAWCAASSSDAICAATFRDSGLRCRLATEGCSGRSVLQLLH